MSEDIWDEVTAELQTFCTRNGEIYRVIGYQPNPTMILEKVRTGEIETHAVGSMNLAEFQQLTVKNPKSE